MFITCQECDTVFRLDESLLKPSGSKVRCSQCGNIFLAHPPKSESVAVETPPDPGGASHTEEAAMPTETDIPASDAEESFTEPEEEEDQELEGIDLAELDAILETDAKEDEAAQTHAEDSAVMSADTVLADLDDSDLDLDFDMTLEDEEETDAESSEETAEDGLEEIDLDMDFALDDDTLAEQAAENQEAPAEETDDDLDFNLDDLTLGDDEETAAVSAASDLKLDASTDKELDLSLDDEARADESSQPTIEETEDAGLDDLELDLDLDMEDDKEEEEEPTEEPDLTLEDEPFEAPADKQTQQAPPAAEGAEIGSASDDLDLSDLDEMLNISEDESAVTDENPDDLELELDTLVDENPPNADIAGDEVLEDLEFELDAEYEDKPVAQSAGGDPKPAPEPEEDEEIDLSDIEKMLESGEIEPSEAGGASGAEGAGGPEKWAAEADTFVDGGEIDLSELEEAIETADSESSDKDTAVDDDLDIDLSLEEDSKESADAVVEDLDLNLEMDEKEELLGGEEIDLDLDLEIEEANKGEEEFELDLDLGDQPADKAEEEDELDLSDLKDMVEEEPAVKSETIDTGDIELEFEIEEEQEPEIEPATTTGRMTLPDLSVEETLTEEQIEQYPLPASKPKVKKKKKTSKGLVFLLILMILGGGGYFGYDYVIKNDIQIPYISDYLNPKPKDPNGILNLSTLDINAKFIENQEAGRIFVISGNVRNGYPGARRGVLMEGKLYSKGKVLVKSERTYAGVTVTDQALASQPVNEIKQQLSRPPQPQDNATRVRAGQSLPFMVVFSDLPPDLDEYAIEPIRSQAAQ